MDADHHTTVIAVSLSQSLDEGITKESEVPDVEINRAVERKKRFEADPKAHTYKPGK
jgi:hypothetical protein